LALFNVLCNYEEWEKRRKAERERDRVKGGSTERRGGEEKIV
jgi:hypothetical protein